MQLPIEVVCDVSEEKVIHKQQDQRVMRMSPLKLVIPSP